MGEANGLDDDLAGDKTAAVSIRRRLAEGSSTGYCGDRRRRTGLSVPALVSAGSNGCESGTTLGGVPHESDCVRLMNFVPMRGGVAAEGAVCGLSCGEELKIGEVRARLGPAYPQYSWSDAG